MLRFRDIIAALAVVVLTRVAYDDPSDSLSATVQLSFYVGREDTSGKDNKDNNDSHNKKLHRLALAPVVFDVDGDGTVEALASVVHDTKSDTWKLEILDLKPATSTDKTHMAPFRPKSLYQSNAMDFKTGLRTSKSTPLVPVQMVTGHVPLKKKAGSSVAGAATLTKTHFKDIEITERNRKYFCGTDWHQASQECSVPCPGGLMTECPDGQQCYADTACDIADLHTKKGYGKADATPSFSVNDLLVTPAGGLPSIFSLWSTGVLAMHSLTGDFPSNSSTDTIPKSKIKQLLGIKQMWEVPVLENKDIIPYEWTGVSVTYVDATDAGDTQSSGGGMVVVQADLMHYDGDNDEELYVTVMAAFDAETGHKIWDVSLGSNTTTSTVLPPLLLPIQDSVQSLARRRSLKPHVQEKKGGGEGMVSNCLHAYRRSLLTSGILPYMYWGEADAANYALHFEQQQHNQHDAIQKKKAKRGAKGPGGGSSEEEEKEHKWKRALTPFNRKRRAARNHNSHNSKPKRGKPNVIVSKSDRGLKVRSLKNGRPVCHLSLWYDTLYTDINNDGVLDAIFAITGNHAIHNDDKYERSEDAKWINKIASNMRDAKQMMSSSQEKEGKGDDQVYQKLCHIMALSGIPTKEELFTVNICGGSKNGKESSSSSSSSGDPPEVAPLLAVESIHGKRGQDIIVATSDKIVQRIGGKKGRKIWEIHGRRYPDFPTWENGYTAIVARIEVPNVVPSARPVVIAGDQSVALISPGHGGVLATASFPQPSIRQPILVDFNGDGTTDIIVLTQEAIWGYRVTVRTGSSIFFRITVGFLAIGLMLAVLRHRFGPNPGKRSTDA